MEKEHLALASVPCQTWGDIYTPEQALGIGTIFQDLNKPFFVTEKDEPGKKGVLKAAPKGLNQREEQMKQITEISFYLDDLALYLDTHPADAEALALFHEYSHRRAEMKMAFAKEHFPLTRDCLTACCGCETDETGLMKHTDKIDTCWCWQEGPVPWEGACV